MLCGMIGMLVTYPFLFSVIPPLFCKNLIFYVLYVWSRRHPTSQANIWGVPMKAIYLPFAYLVLTIFMGNPYYDMIHGYALAHVFYFVADVIPQVYGKDILQTPLFLIDYFGVGHYSPERAEAQEGRNNPWNATGNQAGTTGGAAAGGGAAGRSA